MAYVDLDKVIEVNWGGWSVYPGGDDPAPYPVLTQSIGIFNKPDAWDWDSNGWFGLLNNSNNAVNAQNNNWNTQIAVATDSGVWALSTHVKSFDFSTTIAQIDSGKIKYSIHKQYSTTFWIDEVWGTINNVAGWLAAANLDIRFGHWAGDFDLIWQIVTSWWNRFLVINAQIFPIDADNHITWASTWSLFWTDFNYGFQNRPIAVVDNYIWYVYANNGSRSHWVLASINSSGVPTVISNGDLPTFHDGASNSAIQINDNVAYFTWTNNNSLVEVDLTNVTAFTITTVHNVPTDDHSIKWFDWTQLLILDPYDSNNIHWRDIDTHVWSWSLWVYTGWRTILWDSLQSLTDSDYNYTISWNTINIKWQTYTWTNLQWNKYCWIIYEHVSWHMTYDDFACLIVNEIVLVNDPIDLKINGNIIATLDNDILSVDQILSKTISSVIPITTANLIVELSTANLASQSLALSLWTTGWTYATPTLPANNGMTSGSATTPRVAGTDASYINLTLSA